jgi:hypothetical protein
MWILLTGVFLGLLFPILVEPQGASAQLIQGIPPSPIEKLSGSTERIPEDIYIMPWIAAGVVYDDNVFFQPRNLKQDDVFLRVTPGLQASYQSTPLSVIANYRFDAEEYSKHDNLSTFLQRQFATLDLRGRPTNNWTLNTLFGFAQTRTPFELNVLTSAQAARIKTERYFVNPTTEYRPDALTRIRGEIGVSKDIFGGGPEINSFILNVGMQRRVGTHDWIGPGYVGRHFTFADTDVPVAGFIAGPTAPVTSHAPLVTWAHEFTADTRLEVRAGPRFTDGSLDDRPEAYVGLTRRIQGGELTLAYASALTTVIGTVGALRTDSILIRGAYEPIRHLTFTVAPTAAWIKSDAFSATIYTAYVEAAYQLNKYMTAKGSAYFSYQDSDFVPAGGTTTETFIIPRNVFWLRLEFIYPTRVGE